MTKTQWEAFSAFRSRFRAQCAVWAETAGTAPDGWLASLQKEAAVADENPDYPLETPVVYNHSLDAVTENDDIKIILVGDNPGKDEQLEKNRRYLVGQAGKLGDGFFRKNPVLGIDFRKNVIILNKTPIHTAKTKQLAFIRKKGGERFERLFAACGLSGTGNCGRQAFSQSMPQSSKNSTAPTRTISGDWAPYAFTSIFR